MITLLCGLKDEARIFSGTPGLQVFCGADQRDKLANLVPADCVGLVSAGCAGALASDLSVGDLVVASDVILIDGSEFAPNEQWAEAVGAKTGAVPRPFFSDPGEHAATPADKAALRDRLGADVVDEESFAVAQVAKAHGIPFLVLRAISDTADQTILPHDAQAQRPDGSEDIGPVIDDALRDPAEAFREAEGFGRSLDALRAAFRKLGPTFGLPT